MGFDDNHIALQQHIPVYITYFTAKVNDDGTLSSSATSTDMTQG